jgi:energy-coupling factor transport system ATP-binding protein
MQPEVLILDEPTAGLDPQGRDTLLTSIQSWGTLKPGLTLIVISHNLDHLARLAERVIVLAQGLVVADGPVREVLSDPGLLRAADLDVPLSVELVHKLHKAGWGIRTDCITQMEAAAEIARVHREREAK